MSLFEDKLKKAVEEIGSEQEKLRPTYEAVRKFLQTIMVDLRTRAREGTVLSLRKDTNNCWNLQCFVETSGGVQALRHSPCEIVSVLLPTSSPHFFRFNVLEDGDVTIAKSVEELEAKVIEQLTSPECLRMLDGYFKLLSA